MKTKKLGRSLVVGAVIVSVVASVIILQTKNSGGGLSTWLPDTVQRLFSFSGGTPVGESTFTGRGVQADFGTIEYFPNLKTKIGFANNVRNAGLAEAVPYLDEIGPGLICGNIDFDGWYKHLDDAMENAPLVQKADATGRPIFTEPKPSNWMISYEKAIGDLNVSQLFQLTGAAAQFQQKEYADTGKNINVHPAPADPAGAAAFMGQWTAATNHSYPILWSFWNEPIHTYMEIQKTKNVAGDVILPKETLDEFEIRKRAQMAVSSASFADLYALHVPKIRATTNLYSQLGLASFLTSDFSQFKTTSQNKVYFDAVMSTLKNSHPTATVDFITFNNFNGGWPVSISGARTVLGNRKDVGPLIVTQYSPGSLKVLDEDVDSGDAGSVSPMQVATEMLTDLAQAERAADLRSICMSYWIGGKYGFLNETDGGGLTKTVRYEVIKLFSELPTLRTKLDFSNSDLVDKGVRGLAGINQAKAAVLLWNEEGDTVEVPIGFSNVPATLQQSVVDVTLVSTDGVVTKPSLYADGRIQLPGHSVVLLTIKVKDIPDPLDRRQSLVSNSASPARFLQTKSFVDRKPFPCTTVTALPGFSTCTENTGTYGFYDSVRSVAYLGRGEGTTAAVVTATYENVPPVLYVNPQIYATYEMTDLPLTLSVTFPSCNVTTTATIDSSGYARLDFAKAGVSEACRVGKPATFTFTLLGVAKTGTQAEVYVSSTEAEAMAMASHTKVRTVLAYPVDTKENLMVEPFFNKMTEEEKSVVEAMNLRALATCPAKNITCSGYIGTLTLLDKNDEAVKEVTFTKDKPQIVKAVRGRYQLQTPTGAACTELIGEVETSKGVMNEVTVLCPQ